MEAWYANICGVDRSLVHCKAIKAKHQPDWSVDVVKGKVTHILNKDLVLLSRLLLIIDFHANGCFINTVDICNYVYAMKTADPTIAAKAHFTLVAELAPWLWQTPYESITCQL